MTPAIPSSSTTTSRPVRRQAGSSSPPGERARSRRRRTAAMSRGVLGRYGDRHGRSREIVQRKGAVGSVLIIDRDAVTLGDCRLVAHLGPEEAAGNGALVCREYLDGPAGARGGCREVVAADFTALPYDPPEDKEGESGRRALDIAVGLNGDSYRLELVEGSMSIPALRWRRHHADGSGRGPGVVSVRGVVTALESYAPVCEMTERAVARFRLDEGVSTVRLGAEIERVRLSPIVLNRLLRMAVLDAIEQRSLSMSALALRCGRTKRDRGGTVSGDTSWLSRRIGVLPEAGQHTPTPWVHSDVLALIARRGLGISPREVEVQ